MNVINHSWQVQNRSNEPSNLIWLDVNASLAPHQSRLNFMQINNTYTHTCNRPKLSNDDDARKHKDTAQYIRIA